MSQLQYITKEASVICLKHTILRNNNNKSPCWKLHHIFTKHSLVNRPSFFLTLWWLSTFLSSEIGTSAPTTPSKIPACVFREHKTIQKCSVNKTETLFNHNITIQFKSGHQLVVCYISADGGANLLTRYCARNGFGSLTDMTTWRYVKRAVTLPTTCIRKIAPVITFLIIKQDFDNFRYLYFAAASAQLHTPKYKLKYLSHFLKMCILYFVICILLSSTLQKSAYLLFAYCFGNAQIAWEFCHVTGSANDEKPFALTSPGKHISWQGRLSFMCRPTDDSL